MGEIDYTDDENETSFPVNLNGEIRFFYSHLILNDHPTFDGTFFIQIVESQELNEMLSGWRVQNDTTWRDEYIIFAERNGDVLFFVIPKILHHLFMVVFKKEISLFPIR